jgi:uncharacterized protein (TIGR02246 family)
VLVTRGMPASAARDEELLRALEGAYDEAWSAGDLDGVMECLSPDAVLVNPRGEVASGHEAIRRALGTFLAGEAKGSRHQSTVIRVAFVGDDVAVVDGHARISRPSSGDVLEHPFTDILVRGDGGRWLIAHVRAYRFEDDG